MSIDNEKITTYAVRWVYGDEVVDLALAQGWTQDEMARHTLALGEDEQDIDEIAITHPFNALTEEQVERITKDGRL